MLQKTLKVLGAVGVIAYVILFVRTPSFPTPDKILLFATLMAMAFGQARELLRRFVPFVVLLLVYESFRGLVPGLNTRVNFMFMPEADKFMFFGNLPTAVLQQLWWHGQVMWHDFVFYGAYTLHFVIPFALAALVWKTKPERYWHVVTAFVLVSFMGFLTFLVFPAAPPWMASDRGLVEPITRISSDIWAAFGIHDFPSVYNKISPNPVAAVPSLHAAYSMLFVLFMMFYYKSKWRHLAWMYPILIWVGTTYMGEHYVIDIVIGIIYAILGYLATPYVVLYMQKSWKKLSVTFKSMLQS